MAEDVQRCSKLASGSLNNFHIKTWKMFPGKKSQLLSAASLLSVTLLWLSIGVITLTRVTLTQLQDWKLNLQLHSAIKEGSRNGPSGVLWVSWQHRCHTRGHGTYASSNACDVLQHCFKCCYGNRNKDAASLAVTFFAPIPYSPLAPQPRPKELMRLS